MRNKQNESLFWYKAGAYLKKFLGIIIIIFGFLSFLFIDNLIVPTIIIVIGISLIVWSNYQLFNYKRQSGQIIHKGEWN